MGDNTPNEVPNTMTLTFDEGKLFYELYAALLSFVNEKLKVFSEQFSNSEEYTSTPPEARVAVRDALFAHRELIDEFVKENPAGLRADDLKVVATWKHAVVGKFYIFRYLTKYTIFLSSGGSPNKAYGVLGLADPLEEVVGPYLPRLINAVLLPFKDKIIYDGLLSGHNITFGGGVKRRLNEEYKEAKDAFGIITSLPEGELLPKKPKTQTKTLVRRVKNRSDDAKMALDAIVQMTDAFCKDHLNDEYVEMCRKLATALARKRPSPLLQGKLETWACGIIRTIGRVNYLDDRSQKPYLKLPQIDKAFGVAESTGQGKSQLIRKMLRIRQFDHRWTLPSMMDENPMVWMLEVNGFLMDIRHAPRELQEVAFEKGMIPYVPADRAEAGEE
jgi:hypothetical protein